MKFIYILLLFFSLNIFAQKEKCSSYNSRSKLLVGSLCLASFNLSKIDSRFKQLDGTLFKEYEYPKYYRYLKFSKNKHFCKEDTCRFPDMRPIYYDAKENKLKHKDGLYFVKVE